MSTIATDHAQQVVFHMLQFNHTFSSLEPNAQIVNSTPNASIPIPTSKFKLKKTVQTQLLPEYHIQCTQCKNYSVLVEHYHRGECFKCSAKISTVDSDFFIYVPLKPQLVKIISENFDQV